MQEPNGKGHWSTGACVFPQSCFLESFDGNEPIFPHAPHFRLVERLLERGGQEWALEGTGVVQRSFWGETVACQEGSWKAPLVRQKRTLDAVAPFLWLFPLFPSQLEKGWGEGEIFCGWRVDGSKDKTKRASKGLAAVYVADWYECLHPWARISCLLLSTGNIWSVPKTRKMEKKMERKTILSASSCLPSYWKFCFVLLQSV